MKIKDSDAQRIYFEQEDLLAEMHRQLADADTPPERARLLARMHDARRGQATRHREVFGADFDETDGMDLAESAAYEAQLYLLLSDVERAHTTGRGHRQIVNTGLEDLAGPVLDRMVTDTAPGDIAARARMLKDLDDAVGETIGGQAAEALWQLPSPGYIGWMTLEERDAWCAEQGFGDHFATNSVKFDRLFAVLRLPAYLLTNGLIMAVAVLAFLAGHTVIAAVVAAMAAFLAISAFRMAVPRKVDLDGDVADEAVGEDPEEV